MKQSRDGINDVTPGTVLGAVTFHDDVLSVNDVPDELGIDAIVVWRKVRPIDMAWACHDKVRPIFFCI
jgi:hypothetical protein